MDTFRKRPRKQLWEIPKMFHCAVTGTCLSLEETLKIFRKTGIKIPSGERDYEIHVAAVNASSSKNAISRKMNSFLEEKFIFSIKAFDKADCEDDIMKLWDESLEKGNAAGAFWALMTHPSVSQKNIDRAFGDIHILSHLNGSANRAGIRETEKLRKRVTILTEENEKYKSRLQEIKAIQRNSEEKDRIINRLREDLKKSEIKNRNLTKGLEIEELRGEIMRLTEKYSDLLDTAGKLTRAINGNENIISALRAENSRLSEEISSKDEELLAIEESISAMLERGNISCSGCGKDEQTRINLCGKCILYVGGKPSVVNRCREMVEQYGGRFIHHDGGKEENMSRLPAILHRADVVFCPLDCVSHNASLFVKKMSMRHSKPFMFLKSSGLSSFLKGVKEVNSANSHHDSEKICC